MNAQSNPRNNETTMGVEMATAWIVGLISLALWVTFTPYVALEQARQLALCLASLCGLCVFSVLDRLRKKIALVRELHWDGVHSSAV